MIKLKRKIIGIASLVILEICMIILQIHSIVLCLVNGKFVLGIVLIVGFIAWLLWGWAIFKNNQGDKIK